MEQNVKWHEKENFSRGSLRLPFSLCQTSMRELKKSIIQHKRVRASECITEYMREEMMDLVINPDASVLPGSFLPVRLSSARTEEEVSDIADSEQVHWFRQTTDPSANLSYRTIVPYVCNEKV
jgi:hypothetical protein